MDNLFERAKTFGLQHIKDWLPGGKQSGDEWSALNPTRNDNKIGSFKINLKTGLWMDGSTNDKGPDSVSLYCYLNREKCEAAAREKNYKNLEGGMQAEAARFILSEYDLYYFPSDEEISIPQKKPSVATLWDGFSWAGPLKENIPELDLTWFEKKWGKNIDSWDFKDRKQGEDFLIFKVVRFIDGKKKSDRPFSVWKKGSELKWRAKRPTLEKMPLWNLENLQTDKNINLPVVICEGQKAASRGAQANIEGFVFTGWYGGAGNPTKTDWSPLRGRQCYFWPDGDAPGRAAINCINEISIEYDFKLKIIYPPTGVKKGWDIADAISEGKDIKEIILNGTEAEDQKEDFLDSWDMPFEIIGTSGADIVFYPHGSNRIEKYKASSITKTALLTLADRKIWGQYFMKEGGGIAWDAAINEVIRRSEKTSVFDWRKVRGVGAWQDEDDIIINTGEYLLINGKKEPLHAKTTNYVYEKSFFTPYSLENPIQKEESYQLLACLKNIEWKKKSAPYALAGWLALAAWGGLLEWRPHVWIVGPSGTGKSWVIDKIIMPIVISPFGIRGDGKSTPAGVRQWLQSSAKPFLGDEMESDEKNQAEKLDEIITMFRGASSGQESGSVILHGSTDGQGKQWIVKSMACFASIGSGMIHGADMNRFTICEMSPPWKENQEERKISFRKTQQLAKCFTKKWIKGFHARIYSLLPELFKTIDIMQIEAGDIMNSMREGDQVGSLMAGAWIIEHDKAPTPEEAQIFLNKLDIARLKSDDSLKTDEEKCLDAILSAKVEIVTSSTKKKMSVGSAIDLYFDAELGLPSAYDANLSTIHTGEYSGFTQTILSQACEMIGVQPRVSKQGECFLYVAMASFELKKILAPEGFAASYINMLERLPCFKETGGPQKIGGVSKRFVKMLMR